MMRPDCIEPQVSLSSLTSWLVGGAADFLALPRTFEEARDSVLWAKAQGLPIAVFGGGTNVLVSDRGVEGLTLCLRRLSGATVSGEGRIHVACLAGTSKAELLKIFLKARLAPALFLAGLPGDVGGGVAMNAGVGEMIRPREFVEIVDWIDVLRFDTGAVDRLPARSLEWSYRHCRGWGRGAIVRVGLSWPNEPQADILMRVRAANLVRLSKQPLDQPSCGSVFANPIGGKAGQLIESCGLKGYSVGGAQVSGKHANFIVNAGGATASDIDLVIRHVQAVVRSERGVELQTEVVRLGR